MKFKIGDPVSFVNEKLEGKVVAELPGNCFRVEIEDGFTLDVTAAEIVVRQSFLKGAAPVKQTKPEEVTGAVIDASLVGKVFQSLEGFYLLVIPERSQVLGGNVQWWLYNGTPSDQLYTSALPISKGKETVLGFGMLPPAQAILLKDFLRKDFESRKQVMLRWISCNPASDKPAQFHTRILSPEEPALEQTNSKLEAPFCFTRYHLLDQETVAMDDPEDLKELYEKFNPVVSQKKKQNEPVPVVKSAKKEPDILKQYGLSPGVREIDLHIEELIGDPTSINAAEMIEIQLSAFRKALDRALITRLKEITFIHGVGNGKLRAALRRELTELGYKFRDGSYEKYGSGATTVSLTA